MAACCVSVAAMGTYEHDGISTPASADGGRPSFWRVAVAVLVGLAWSYLWLWLLWFGFSLLGVIGQRSQSHPPANLWNWLYPGTGAWATVANLTVFALVCGIVAASVQGAVARRTKRSISGQRVFVPTLIAGMVLVNNHGNFGRVATVWLVLSFALQRFAFVGDRDDSRNAPRPRIAVLAAALALLGLLATTGAYAVSHPLWYSSYLPNGTGAANRVAFHVRPGGSFRYTFQLQNAGFAPITLQSVRAPGSTTQGPGHFAQLLGATVAEYPRPAGFGPPGQSIPGAHIAGRGSAWITLNVRIIPCIESGREPGPAALNSVNVNYRILGLNQSQTIPLDAPPTVLCRH